jgi:hypothetical protein
MVQQWLGSAKSQPDERICPLVVPAIDFMSYEEYRYRQYALLGLYPFLMPQQRMLGKLREKPPKSAAYHSMNGVLSVIVGGIYTQSLGPKLILW